MAAQVTLKANAQLRKEMQEHNLSLWMIADEMGVTESTLCRRLRHELEETAREEIKAAMNKLTMAAV